MKHRSLLVLILFSLALALAGCGTTAAGGGPYPTSASCDTQGANGQCRDWSNPSGTVDFSYSCNGMSGTYATSACTATNLVGSCTLAPILGTTAIYRYYSPTYDAGSATTHCTTLGGTFSR